MPIIKELKEQIKKLNPGSKVYVRLKHLRTNDWVKYNIIKISRIKIGIDLTIGRKEVEIKTIEELLPILKNCSDNDLISYTLNKSEGPMQKPGNIDGKKIIEGDLYLTSILELD